MQNLKEFFKTISPEQWEVFQGYGFFFLVVFMVVVLYSYCFHLYRSERKGARDYEKYSKLALNDEINDTILEKRSS